MISNRKQSRDELLGIVESWQQSGLSKKRFCTEQQISYNRFCYWHRRHKLQNATADNGGSAFIALHLPATATSAELIYPDGRRLLFHQGVDALYLKALLA